MKENKLVKHKNELIPEFIRLGLQEKRLLAFCISKINSKYDKSLGEISIPISELSEFYQLGSSGAVYSRLKEAAISINSKPIERITQKSYRLDFWFNSIQLSEDSGKITVEFNPSLAPLLLDLQGDYLSYSLSMAVDFNNSTWSLYNVVKQWRKSGSKSFNLHELKDLLGVAGKYPRWVDFKKRYLDQSIKDINACSDIEVSYETQKEGRKISGVVFFIDKKQPDDVITLEPEKDVLYKALLDYGINSKVALQYSREAEEADKTAYIIERLPKIKARWDKKKEGNLQAYVTTAVQQEIRQGNLLNYTPEQPKKLEHSEAWKCLQEKKRLGEQCAVRERGIPGQRKRCKICLEKLPVAEFGI